MDCPNSDCAYKLPVHVDRCPVCGRDVGFPNVRAAQAPAEVAALEAREDRALQRAAADDRLDKLEQFRQAVKNSQAAICRKLSVLQQLVSSDNELYATFYELVRAEARLPQDNAFDRVRNAIDALLFPNYHEKIRFAALTLDGCGVPTYGDYTMVLRDQAIRLRATVFEENSFVFMKYKAAPYEPPPPGHMAIWDHRDKLAVAKLGDRIEAGTKPEDFPRILLCVGATPEDDQFIEVHIYGPIHRRAIERVVGPVPKSKEDCCIFEDLRNTLEQIGVRLETS